MPAAWPWGPWGWCSCRASSASWPAPPGLLAQLFAPGARDPLPPQRNPQVLPDGTTVSFDEADGTDDSIARPGRG